MGAIAEGVVAYVRPLVDQTDGSLEQMNKAMAIGQLCWNLALLPKEDQDATLAEMRQGMEMDDEEFDDFRRNVVAPMILRHQEMFPLLHRRFPTPASPYAPSSPARPNIAARTEKHPGTDRYAPCPCNSGRKYKFCCGAKSR